MKIPWQKGTYLIVGDSILAGVQERKMGNKVKVRSLPGAYICDLYYHLQPMIERKPDGIILMIGTNDAVDKGSHEILNELLDLRN